MVDSSFFFGYGTTAMMDDDGVRFLEVVVDDYSESGIVEWAAIWVERRKT